MNILVLGGTRFLGRHIVNSALARGHQITLFNRGKSNPNLFPNIEVILGDREHDIDKLSDRAWDAVIDTCGYVPRIVHESAVGLERSVGRYVFISSISVYPDSILSKIGIDESDPVGKLEDETVEEITGETYGPLKALCEKLVFDMYGDRGLVVRPGLVVGPNDISDRFTYWPVRIAKGRDVLAPEKPDVPVQIIDVRDLSDFVIKLIETEATGIYNATGPEYELTLGAMLETCKQISGSDANFKWASVEFLKQNNVAEWSDMPVWIPNNEESQGFSRMNVSKGIKAGLKFRPLEDTVRDTLAWANTRPADHEWRAGLRSEREQELLNLLNQ
ncbi:MAG: SDR family oxidoreductase [Anaerolineales bacterium]|nr:SDR family oxidoreductase [Anaerolineales bacterium]